MLIYQPVLYLCNTLITTKKQVMRRKSHDEPNINIYTVEGAQCQHGDTYETEITQKKKT